VKRVRSRLFTAAVCLAFAAFAVWGQADVDTAKAEGKVTFYANITAIEPILAEFASTYGFNAEYVRVATDKFVPTVLTEFQAGKLLADVVQGPLPILQILKEQGVLGSYVSPTPRCTLTGPSMRTE